MQIGVSRRRITPRYTVLMIGSLRGTVIGMVRDTVIIETGGIGYGAFVPVSVLAKTKEGDTLFVTPPAGNFFRPPKADGPNHFLLFAGGSGITPRGM